MRTITACNTPFASVNGSRADQPHAGAELGMYEASEEEELEDDEIFQRIANEQQADRDQQSKNSGL